MVRRTVGYWAMALFPMCAAAQAPLQLIPDASFGDNGVSRTQLPAAFDTLAVVSDDDTYVYALSAEPTGGASEPEHYVTRRLKIDGSLEDSFGTGGTVTIAPLAAAGEQRFPGLCTDPASGAIYLVGTSSQAGDEGFDVVRLLADGSPDPAWDGDGHLRIVVAQGKPSLFACLVQADGKLVVAGADGAVNADDLGITNYAFTARLTTMAALDPGYGVAGVARFVPFAATPQAYFALTRIAPASGDSLLFGGHARTAAAGAGGLVVMKVISSGTLVSGFGDGGIVVADDDGELAVLRNQANGEVVVARLALTSAPSYGVVVRRLDNRGAWDLSYACGGSKSGQGGISGLVPSGGHADLDGDLLLIGHEMVGIDEHESVARIDGPPEFAPDAIAEIGVCRIRGSSAAALGVPELVLLALAWLGLVLLARQRGDHRR